MLNKDQKLNKRLAFQKNCDRLKSLQPEKKAAIKVLITCDLFPPDVLGGTEIVVYNQAKVLKDKGFDITVICRGDPDIKEYEGIRTIRTPLNRFYLANILLIPKIFKNAINKDIIHNHTFDTTFPSILAAKILNKPSIMTCHGVYGLDWVEMRKSCFMGHLRSFFEKVQMRLPYDKILFVSEQTRELGIKQGAPLTSNVLTAGLDLKKFKPLCKEPFVLFVGRLAMQKGLDYLVEAAKQLPDIPIKIVGWGSEEGRLKSRAPHNVEFLGFIANDDPRLYELYGKALVFCLPSIGEGLPLVMLEAMASSCAIVSTVKIDFSGFHIKSRSITQIADKLRYLFAHQEEAVKMGEENRQKVRNYRWENILSIYEEFFQIKN